MAEYADLTLGSLAYDPFGAAVPQIEFPPEREEEQIPRQPAPAPEAEAGERRRVRLGTAEDAAARAAARRGVIITAAVVVPAVLACMALIVLLLQANIRLTAISSEAARLERRIAALQTERSRLEIQCESAFNMEEVEQVARTSIGMIKADADQAIYLRSTTEDLAVILDGERKAPSLLTRAGRFLDKLGAYFAAGGA